MNADNPKLDDSDPVHALLEEFVWLARDLQQRARLDPLPEILYVRIDEIKERANRLGDYFYSVKAGNPMWVEGPEADDQADADQQVPGQAPTSAAAAAAAAAASSSPKKPKGGKS